MKSKLKKAMQSLYHYFRKFLSVLLVVSVITLPLSTSVSAASNLYTGDADYPIYDNCIMSYASLQHYKKTNPAHIIYPEPMNDMKDLKTGFPYSNRGLMVDKLYPLVRPDGSEIKPRYPDKVLVVQNVPLPYFYVVDFVVGDGSQARYHGINLVYTENPLIYDPANSTGNPFMAKGRYLTFFGDKYGDISGSSVSSSTDKDFYGSPFGSNTNRYSVFHPSGPLHDADGNRIDLKNGIDYDPEGDKYRKQTSLERYSNYTIERYPNANPLQKFNGWYTRPEQAYNDDKVVKMGGNSAFKHLYFGETPSNTNILSLKGSYFTYHLYYWDGLAWGKRSIWISRPLKFVPSGASGDGMPQLSCERLSSVVIVDYRSSQISMSAKIVSYKNMYDLFQGSTAKRYYLINDDSKVKEDTSGSNHGTITTDNNDNYVDDSGTIVDKPNLDIEIEGSNDNGNFFTGIIDWFQSLFDGIASVFQTIGNGFSSIVGSCGDFFAFLGSAFSFLPAPFWAVVIAGVSILVFLRILGR